MVRFLNLVARWRSRPGPETQMADMPRDLHEFVTAKAAHEVNNLMTIVIANIDLAARRPSDDNQRKHLHRANWAANLAARLIRQALVIVRDDGAAFPEIDINAAIAGMDSLPYQLEERDIRLVHDLAPLPLPIRIDPDQLELSLINLLRNAVDATPDGGTVTIASKLALKQGWVDVLVTDTGGGIPEHILERVSEPFFTTKTPSRGTGLGLAVVRAFIERAGGTMKISSRVGEGTTVTLSFQGAEENQAANERVRPADDVRIP